MKNQIKRIRRLVVINVIIPVMTVGMMVVVIM